MVLHLHGGVFHGEFAFLYGRVSLQRTAVQGFEFCIGGQALQRLVPAACLPDRSWNILTIHLQAAP